jgi:hypothetical protein
MNPSVDLQKQLTNYIVLHSGFDKRRPYIGLSGIGDCEAVIYDRYMHGQTASIEEQMKTAISYDLEACLVAKLKKMRLYKAGPDIVLYHGLVQGHTDGKVGDDLLEIKSLPREEYFPEHHLAPRIFWQVQAYMHYLDIAWCQVVYIARDTGCVRVYPIRYHERRGEEVAMKVDRLVIAVGLVERPKCSCGRCREG